LLAKGIVYAPDFLINAGGLINCYSELEGYNRDRAMQQAENIYNSTLHILNTAANEGITPMKAAMQVAENRIASIASIHTTL
jgi:leucine dehydrogenase